MPIDAIQYRDVALVPMLAKMNPVFPGALGHAAVNCMMGIAWHESKGGRYLKQIKGPALGANQVEPFTHQGLWNNFINYRSDRVEFALSLLPAGVVLETTQNGDQHRSFEVLDHSVLATDIAYNIFIARLVLYRSSFQWPADPRDIAALGLIWDDYFNKNPEKGFVSQYVEDYPEEALT